MRRESHSFHSSFVDVLPHARSRPSLRHTHTLLYYSFEHLPFYQSWINKYTKDVSISLGTPRYQDTRIIISLFSV